MKLLPEKPKKTAKNLIAKLVETILATILFPMKYLYTRMALNFGIVEAGVKCLLTIKKFMRGIIFD